MNPIGRSTLALILLGTLVSAEGECIPPIEPKIPTIRNRSLQKLYTGGGYTDLRIENQTTAEKINGNALMLFAGYRFFEYLALEGRYTFTTGDLENKAAGEKWKGSNIALYLKPNFTIANLSAYGLLGYGQTALDNGTDYSEKSFQWGVGANYSATKKLDVYLDYTHLFDDTGFEGFAPADDIAIKSFNLGISYNF